MKCYQFAVGVAAAVALCALAVCESRPSNDFSPEDYSLDCGKLGSTNGPMQDFSSGDSLVTRMIRGGMFQSTFEPTYKCWKCTNITEYRTLCGKTAAIQAVVEFAVEKAKIERIHGAQLTVVQVYSDDITEEDKEQLDTLKVKGASVGSGDGIKQSIPASQNGHVVPGMFQNQTEFNFNPLTFLQAVTQHENEVECLDGHDAGVDNGEITVKFTITRKCGNLTLDACPPIFDVDVHMPSLRVFYV